MEPTSAITPVPKQHAFIAEFFARFRSLPFEAGVIIFATLAVLLATPNAPTLNVVFDYALGACSVESDIDAFISVIIGTLYGNMFSSQGVSSGPYLQKCVSEYLNSAISCNID